MKTKVIKTELNLDSGPNLTILRTWHTDLRPDEMSVSEYYTEVRCGPFTLRLSNSEAVAFAERLEKVAMAPEPPMPGEVVK